ncbi:MAG: tRNA-uridine aminocarboxypropyltransferase [Pseudomonadota bacterium]
MIKPPINKLQGAQAQPLKRPRCLQCSRPLSTCICKHIQRVANHVELVILQHPLEVNEAKNSALLLHLCLHNSQLHAGEQFNADFFASFNLNTPHLTTYNLLLYPETSEEKSLGITPSPAMDNERLGLEMLNIERSITGHNLNKNAPIRLWVLDATWRKSRKMLYLNPLLQTMPRLKLDNCAPTMYSIRKAHSENQLSTLEASCYALQQLEQNLVDYTPILRAFAGFIAQQKTFIPSSHL